MKMEPSTYDHYYSFKPVGLYGTSTLELEGNPDRGLRLEMYLDVASGRDTYDEAGRGALETLEEEVLQYLPDQPRLAQTYFYLTGYKERDLDDQAFERMQTYLYALRRHRIKSVLRFAYIFDDVNLEAQEPSTRQVVRHIQQLAPFVRDNRHVIHVLQIGMIGAWGEWDVAARSRMHERLILEQFLAAMPDDLFVQVRYMNIKNVNFEPDDPFRKRIGFHDDFLIHILHPRNTAGDDSSSEEFKQLDKESADVLVDGELIWGRANGMYANGESIDGLFVAERLRRHHFTSLSLKRNYMEDGKRYSMWDWQQQPCTSEMLDAHRLPYEENWFRSPAGLASKTLFDYIKDYLGYYIKAEEVRVGVRGAEVNVSVTLLNYGFAAPLGMKRCEMLLLDKDERIAVAVEMHSLASLKSLEPVHCALKLLKPDRVKRYKLGIRLINSARDCAKLANELHYANGINILHDNI
ncbi:DUF4874 domain-containing protein [Paenibacillus lignilyticus]|uniref:DUF4874 domain-containing protein n=1 Tax=Paenibacillus lignilyticus TaxID=1172615 RepID=A0ABS5CN82_9BACL|nr:DUF4874 domain-containing protein [Paenibacillus lignilyticus]MBP3967314.1 DUF4874 domain-containing protein [Paenibacillus lignilyticus]